MMMSGDANCVMVAACGRHPEHPRAPVSLRRCPKDHRRGGGGRVRIPKRVNDAWDWAERHAKGLTVTVILIVVAASSLFVPTLAVLILGGVAGASLPYPR